MGRAPAGERNDGVGPVRPFVPGGTRFIFTPQPSDESLGYFRASLRDADSRHADKNRFQAKPTFGTRMRGRAAQVPSLSQHDSQIDSIDARKRMDGHCGDRFRQREPVRGRLCLGLSRGLDALRGDILPRSPRNFALLAEGRSMKSISSRSAAASGAKSAARISLVPERGQLCPRECLSSRRRSRTWLSSLRNLREA
jgi:hypothetical protein